MDRISKQPRSVTVDTAPDADGCLSVTLVTAPLPERMQSPRRRARAKPATQATTSHVAGTSSTCARSADAQSLLMITGGFGLFLEPRGRPRGRRMWCSPPVAAISCPWLLEGSGSDSSAACP